MGDPCVIWMGWWVEVVMIRARVVTKTPGRFVDVFDSVLAAGLAFNGMFRP